MKCQHLVSIVANGVYPSNFPVLSTHFPRFPRHIIECRPPKGRVPIPLCVAIHVSFPRKLKDDRLWPCVFIILNWRRWVSVTSTWFCSTSWLRNPHCILVIKVKTSQYVISHAKAKQRVIYTKQQFLSTTSQQVDCKAWQLYAMGGQST